MEVSNKGIAQLIDTLFKTGRPINAVLDEVFSLGLSQLAKNGKPSPKTAEEPPRSASRVLAPVNESVLFPPPSGKKTQKKRRNKRGKWNEKKVALLREQFGKQSNAVLASELGFSNPITVARQAKKLGLGGPAKPSRQRRRAKRKTQ